MSVYVMHDVISHRQLFAAAAVTGRKMTAASLTFTVSDCRDTAVVSRHARLLSAVMHG